ncbi:MAG: hypothetical protein ACW98F_00015 [Candidatus Hodarchaeales archaeon]|jgi:hypothetical protein
MSTTHSPIQLKTLVDFVGDLDDIDDGATHKRTDANERDGGGFAYSHLDSSGLRPSLEIDIGSSLYLATDGSLRIDSDDSTFITASGELLKNVISTEGDILIDSENKRIGGDTSSPVIGYEGIVGGHFSTGTHARKVGTQTVTSILTPTEEFITDGDMSSSTNWTEGSGWSISGGVAANNLDGDSSLDQTLVSGLQVTRDFHWTFDVANLLAGTAYLELRDQDDSALVAGQGYANGSHDETFTTTKLITEIKIWCDVSACNDAFDIDNVSIKQESADVEVSNVDGFPNAGWAYMTGGGVSSTDYTWRVIYHDVDRIERKLLNTSVIGFRQYSSPAGSWGSALGAHELEDGFIVTATISGVQDVADKIVMDTYDDTLVITDYMGQVALKALQGALTMPAGNLTLGAEGTITVGTSGGQRIYLDGSTSSLQFYDSSNNEVITIDDSIWGGDPGIKLTSGVIYDVYGSGGSPLGALGVWTLQSYLNLASDEAIGLNIETYQYGADPDGDNYGISSILNLSTITSSVARATAVRGEVSMGAKTSTQRVSAIYGNAPVQDKVYAGYFQGDVTVTDSLHTDELQIRYDNDTGAVLSVDSAGVLDITTSGLYSTWNSDTSYYVEIGRAYIGHAGWSDYAAFGHLDHRTTGNYGFMQYNNGDSFVNVPTGRAGYLRVNNADIVSWNVTDFDVDADLQNKDVVYASGIEGGDNQTRTLTITVKEIGDGATSRNYHSVHWWISDSEFGAPAAMAGTQTVSVTTGTHIDPASEDDNQLNVTLTNASKVIVITITNAYETDVIPYYLMTFVQGVTYCCSFSMFTSGA